MGLPGAAGPGREDYGSWTEVVSAFMPGTGEKAEPLTAQHSAQQ